MKFSCRKVLIFTFLTLLNPFSSISQQQDSIINPTKDKRIECLEYNSIVGYLLQDSTFQEVYQSSYLRVSQQVTERVIHDSLKHFYVASKFNMNLEEVATVNRNFIDSVYKQDELWSCNLIYQLNCIETYYVGEGDVIILNYWRFNNLIVSVIPYRKDLKIGGTNAFYLFLFTESGEVDKIYISSSGKNSLHLINAENR